MIPLLLYHGVSFAAELDTKMSETQTELEKLREDNALKDEEIGLLKTAMSEKDEESQKRQSMLEERLSELERLRAGQCSISCARIGSFVGKEVNGRNKRLDFVWHCAFVYCAVKPGFVRNSSATLSSVFLFSRRSRLRTD